MTPKEQSRHDISTDPSKSPSRDFNTLLATCPQEKRDRFKIRASRALTSKVTAIRIKCLECCAWNAVEVSKCQIIECALWGMGGQKKKRS
jgi:hypothetical protein